MLDVLSMAWELRLLALMHERPASCDLRLYEMSFEHGARWRPQPEDVPEDVNMLVADGGTVYALGSAETAWRLDRHSKHGWCWEPLPQRPPQHAPEAVVVDGKLLVLGGHETHVRVGGPGYVTGAASVYCPESDTWTTLPSMPTCRGSGFACAAAGYSVYVAGGIGHLGVLCSADMLDLRSCTWARLPDMASERFACAGFANGERLSVLGGQFDESCESWHRDGVGASCPAMSDGASDITETKSPCEWTSMTPLPFKDMWIRVVPTDNDIYVHGRTQVARLDVSTGAWSSIPAAPGHRIVAMCAAFIQPRDGYLFEVGKPVSSYQALVTDIP